MKVISLPFAFLIFNFAFLILLSGGVIVPRFFENRQMISQAISLGVLALVLCTLLIYRFTTRSSQEEERARAHSILRSLYEIERAYFEAYGTYLPVDRDQNGDILKLNDTPGRFRYRVEADRSTFVAVAEADLDGDGEAEVWQVDPANPDPVLKRQD